MIYPWKLWQTQVYDNCGGYDDHTIVCEECIFFLHFQNRYNVVIDGVDKTSKPNRELINRDIRGDANDGSGARQIAERLWNSNCYYGVHVIKRYVDEWTFSDMEDRMKQELGG